MRKDKVRLHEDNKFKQNKIEIKRHLPEPQVFQIQQPTAGDEENAVRVHLVCS